MVFSVNNNFDRFQAKRSFAMQPKRPLGIFFYACGTSTFFVVLGILLVALWSVIYGAILRSNLVLKPGSTAFDVWKKNPVPLTLKLFVYNWTNSKDIYTPNVKPKFQQLGPYTFAETKEKTSIKWNKNNTVTYKILKRWWFDPERSNGNLSDVITTINPVALSAAYSVRNWHYIMKRTFSFALRTAVQQIDLTRPVGEILFDGYEDPLLSAASKFPSLTKGIPVTEKFGWFYGRNGSENFEGEYNINTGVDGQIGELRAWKYSDTTPYNPGHCGRFDSASGGDFFPNQLTKKSIIKLFSSDLCRYVALEFEREVVIHGIVGYKYSAGDLMLDNGTKIPENKCFCVGDCMPYGAMNTSNCRHGSPAFVSLPHFYKADPSYLQPIEGVKSSPADNFYMTFEPNTGIPLEVAARLQLNLLTAPIGDITLFENIPSFYFPVLYFEQLVTLPSSMTFQLKILINFKVICWAVGFSCIVLGLFILFCACYKLCTVNVFGKKKAKQKTFVREAVPLNQ